MNLIALLIGLIVERLATQLFHWRRMRWLDGIIDAGFRQAGHVSNWPVLIPILLLAILLVLPIYLVILGLGGTLAGFTYLILAVIVLFFSFGPTDIGEEVDEYCDALTAEDAEAVHNAATAIVEGQIPDDTREQIRIVEQAIFVQANNRVFAIIFWFVVLGPLGAWAYRVTDMIRRRAVFNHSRGDATNDETQVILDTATMLHGWLAWIPARLTAVGFAAAGHFDEAFAAMRVPTEQRDASMAEHSENLLARVGTAALALHDKADESVAERGIRGATAARRLVFRQLIIWAVIISAMTLYGLTR